MKRKVIISIILMVSILVMTSILFVSSAANTAAPNPSQYVGDTNTNVTQIGTIGNQVITIISTVGSVASVIVLVILGIRYMMGSAEEKAEYKKVLMPYVIGAALVFAASAIAGIVFSVFQNIG